MGKQFPDSSGDATPVLPHPKTGLDRARSWQGPWLGGLVVHPRADVKWQADLIPTWSPGRLVLLAVGFALFNAAMEEMIWRGVVFHALERTGLPTVPVVLIQALSFGVAHLHGFPSGSVGILLASAYGAILGVLRSQTRGLLVPFVTHAATDFFIFEILVYLAHD